MICVFESGWAIMSDALRNLGCAPDTLWLFKRVFYGGGIAALKPLELEGRGDFGSDTAARLLDESLDHIKRVRVNL